MNKVFGNLFISVLIATKRCFQHDPDFSLKYESTRSFNLGECVIHRLFFFVSPEWFELYLIRQDKNKLKLDKNCIRKCTLY